jgi:hypothetical protein
MSIETIHLFLITGVFVISGCGVGADDPSSSTGSIAQQIISANANADSSLHLLARVSLDETSEVAEFYEPSPGRILFSMAGRPSNGPALTQKDVAGKPIADVWQMVSHGAPMPDALASALKASPAPLADHVDRAASAGAPTSTAAPESSRGLRTDLTNGYCGTQWLSDFPCPGSGHSDQWCQYDQWGTDNAWVNNGTGWYFNVCSEIGSVMLNLSGNTVQGSWTVLENTYRWYSWQDGSTYCWSCFSVFGACIGSGGCAGYLNESASVTPQGSAAYNWEGTLDWP